MTSLPTVVEIKGVSKKFVLHKDKSLKERVIGFRNHSEHRIDFWALRDIDLEIPLGTTLGLIGANGSGKSTLLKVIGGILQPTTGTVRRRGRFAALLELGAGFHPDLTGRENVYLNASILGLSQKDTQKHFDEIVDFSGIEDFIDTQVKFYSSGMYVRLAFAVAINVDPDLLLVDEVLAVGDEPFQRKCMDKIRGFQNEGRTIVFVSHSAEQVGALCDRVVLLDHGNMVVDDVPEVAIRALRAGFEEAGEVARSQKAQAAAKARDAGEAEGPAVQITAIEVLTDGSDERQTFIRSGQDAVVRVKLEVARRVSEAAVGFVIETPIGQGLFSTNTHDLGVMCELPVGQQHVDFRLPALALGEGHYNISATATDLRAGESLDAKSQLGSFSVRDANPGQGVISVDASLLPSTLTTPLPDKVRG